MKKILLSTALIASLALPSFASEEGKATVSGYLKGEFGVSSDAGNSYNNESGDGFDGRSWRKAEVTAKFFLNGDIGEESTWHAELQFIRDAKAIRDYQGHHLYTQHDYFRELYVDTMYDDWEIRVGKQQLVWGTADGVKFLDIINPTDYREWGQNTMEDSRIPLWMMVAEKPIGDGDSTIQLVWVPDINRINQIPGLLNPTTGDRGQPFVSKGADSITGQYNGFLNIGPEMGKVALNFASNGGYLNSYAGLTGTASDTVEEYTLGTKMTGFGQGSPAKLAGSSYTGFAANNKTNLMDDGASTTTALSYDAPNSMFEYMGDTTFATFAGFVGMTTEYRVDEESRKLSNHNLGLRYKSSTDSGLNYSFNYYYHWDNNPVVDMHWEDHNGNRLETYDTKSGNYTTIRLRNAKTKADYNNATYDGSATLVFTQSLNRIQSFGTSFDYAVDTDFAPVVIRGEFLYDKDTKVPVVDLGRLGVGDLVGAFKMEYADMLKYVIGVDVTVMTNLFMSFQFMDIWNLDHVDTQSATQGANGRKYTKFTANPASLSLTNGFDKADEHEIMYTLFLSKPFMESDALRVNNLFLYERTNGGFWNRFDLEYSYSDNMLLTAEYNMYGGDRDGMFGQFEDMSNIQAGFKYLF
jgi:hypothetical protein